MRRKARVRKARIRHLKIGFLVFLIFAILIGVTLSLTVLFPIKQINVSGSDIYSEAELIKASKAEGKNLFTVSKKQMEIDMQNALPFVDSIKISRKMPDILNIKVTDAAEFAAYNVNGKYFTVSEKGIALNEYLSLPENTFEIKAEGITCRLGNSVKFKNGKTKETVDILIKELTGKGIKIDYIDASNLSGIELGVMSRFKVILGSKNDLSNKIAHLASMIKNISPEKSGTVNLSMWTPEKREGTFIKSNEK